MKKVLIVDIGERNGGIEKYIYNLYEHINKTEFIIDFLVYVEHCAYEEVFIKNSNIFHVTSRRKNPFKHYQQLKCFFENNDYDVVWIQTCSASNILPHKLAKKYSKARLISHAHVVKAESKGKIYDFITNVLHKYHQKELRKITDVALACSYEAGSYLFGEEYAENVQVVYNGIEIQAYVTNDEMKNRNRRQVGFDVNDVILGHVGRFSLVKNHKFLLDVFEKYYEKQPNARMLLVGDGEEKQNIEKEVLKRNLTKVVTFMGERDDIPQMLSMMDVFLFPSINEGFGIVAIEAQAAGIPIIVNTGLSCLLNVSNYFYQLSVTENVNVWVNKIEEILMKKNRKCDKRIGEFDINTTSKKIEKILRGEI